MSSDCLIHKRSLLLTGATGFLGSHLAHAFLKSGYRVAILKRAQSNLSRLKHLLSDLQIFNIEDGLDTPFKVMGHLGAVVHAATCYGRKKERVSEIFESNTAFPLHLLETAKLFNTDAFLNTNTTLYKYLNAYSLSKHHFMEWAKSFAGDSKIKFFNINVEHIYGPGDDPTKFTTHVIRTCLSNAPHLELTSGDQQRDFVHVDDVVNAYVRLLGKAVEFNHGFFEFGVGTGKAVSIREFASMVQRLAESSTQLIFGALAYRDQEVMYSQADITALQALGWSCEYDLEAGLKQAIKMERNSL